MKQLLYVHGFLSSPLSYKASTMAAWVNEHYPTLDFISPSLTPYPNQCAEVLEEIVESAQLAGIPCGVVGSSMGGFWATYLAERYNLPAVLVNPAVDALNLMPQYIEQPLKNYHTEAVYRLCLDDLSDLASYDTPTIRRHDNYWLLAQQGDKTLDYQLAANKYQACRQTIEPGGDHSFQGFARFHADVITFFEKFYEQPFR